MGRGDDSFLEDEREDAVLRRLLARAGEPAQVSPPSDLVARTARRLPAEAPALAARRIRRRRAGRLAIYSVGLAALALMALVGLADVLASRPQLAMLFGDGTSGLSRALLTLHLLVKPALWTVGAAGAPLLLAGCVAVAGAAWLWWWLFRRTPAFAVVEQAP